MYKGHLDINQFFGIYANDAALVKRGLYMCMHVSVWVGGWLGVSVRAYMCYVLCA